MYTLNSRIKIKGVTISHKDFDNCHFTLKFKQTKSSIKATLTAKEDLTMESLAVTGECLHDETSLFFVNGYQSWTTSREYAPYETVNDLMPLARKLGGFAEYAAGIMSDYSFAEYGKKGIFRSYTYTYFRKKGEDNIILYGSRSERKGFTVFEYDSQNKTFTVGKDVEGLCLKKGQEYEIFDIAVISGNYDKVFDKYFFKFIGVNKPKIDHLAGYTSWYNYFSHITEEICHRDLEGLMRAKDIVDIFQIDDGYQTATGDWLSFDKKKFPHGMKSLAEKIHQKGLLAGIWLAPFCAQLTSKVAREHPDWMIKNEKTGKPMIKHVGWGGAYALDIYNEEARDYIKYFFDVILNDWGYDMVKLDFLFTQCITPRNGKTRGEIMCDGVDLLREACGDKLILGCGVPLGACMGIFDACRISCDANKVFEGNIVNKLKLNNEIPSTQGALNNAVFRRHLDGRAFCNDPDVLFLRDSNIKYNDEQKYLLGKINALCGNVLFVSDNVGDYNEKALSLMDEFFTKKDTKVLRGEYLDSEHIKLDYIEDGEKKAMIFNINSGKLLAE